MIAAAPLRRELRASYAFVERNINLTKRYWGWEIAFLVYSIAQSASVVYISDTIGQVSGHKIDPRPITLYLAIGALTWSYVATLFICIAESVQWERWEGTIEYSMMAPISILTYLLGSCLFGVVYGLIRTMVVLLALATLFHLDANGSGLLPVVLFVAVGSFSFVGLGIFAAILPLLFTEKGAQMTFVIESCLLLVSGVYYDVSVLPAWLQPISHISPATYVLRGIRQSLMGHPSSSDVLTNLLPLIFIGVVTVPLGVWLFTRAERFAKRTGRLKRTG